MYVINLYHVTTYWRIHKARQVPKVNPATPKLQDKVKVPYGYSRANPKNVLWLRDIKALHWSIAQKKINYKTSSQIGHLLHKAICLPYFFFFTMKMIQNLSSYLKIHFKCNKSYVWEEKVVRLILSKCSERFRNCTSTKKDQISLVREIQFPLAFAVFPRLFEREKKRFD